MNKIAILPLDDRPVNYDYPRLLAAIAGLEVELPPREWLGNPWQEAQHANLAGWLEQAAPAADALIIAVDTLAYGGLIPSRSSPVPFETVVQRLEILSKLKDNDPDKPIYASSVIQRISRANSSEEEKPYWGEYGSRMFHLSYLEHKSALGEASAAEIKERDQLKQAIPAAVYDDYLGIRARNHQVNRYALQLVKDGVLDYLLLPQDDTADYGWNISEARSLQMEIRRENLTDLAITYPGADEIGSLLLARCICAGKGFRPGVFPRFSSSSSISLITKYEDRPMLELLKAHLAPLGGIVSDDADGADIILFINAPAVEQGVGELQWAAQFSREELLGMLPENVAGYVDNLFADEYFQATRREMQTPLRSPEEFCRAIVDAVRKGKNTAVADVAFVNGSDLLLGDQLSRKAEIGWLAAYGGWNTAGNTLGTVLAQAAIFTLAKELGLKPRQHEAQLEFLFLRFLDDYCFQARERSLCMLQDLPACGLMPGEERLPDDVIGKVEQKLAERLEEQVRSLEKTFRASGLAGRVNVSNIHLPWRRLFEIAFDVKVELS